MLNTPYPLPVNIYGSITPLLGGYFYDELILCIENAKHSIKAVQYQWKWNIHERNSLVQRLGNSVKLAQKRGVQVSVILNQQAPNSHLTKINKVTGDNLTREGVQVRNRNPAGLLHTKLWIIDNSICFVGSHNISTRSFTVNEELTLKVESKELASFLSTYFSILWGD